MVIGGQRNGRGRSVLETWRPTVDREGKRWRAIVLLREGFGEAPAAALSEFTRFVAARDV